MFSHQLNSKRNYPVLLFKTIFRHLGTSHNLSWGGGGGGETGGPSLFFGWNMGGLEMPKDDLGAGVFKFLLRSIPTEQHDA